NDLGFFGKGVLYLTRRDIEAAAREQGGEFQVDGAFRRIDFLEFAGEFSRLIFRLLWIHSVIDHCSWLVLLCCIEVGPIRYRSIRQGLMKRHAGARAEDAQSY